ncbi:uncharacterized protein LOC132874955 [Neoarius graeffei]|uniref:uncharacterized protein LOC132874955 n=1 Tax=Neoarius graeffei TaxID=443677 RepID=UPI00298C996E|nr:uncharacterized protein LOC132874955 [Neoarius graeffei]
MMLRCFTLLVLFFSSSHVTNKSEEKSSVEITEGEDGLLNCSFILTEGYNNREFIVYWIKTNEKNSNCVYSYNFERDGITFNHHCNVQEELLSRLSNHTEGSNTHNIRISNVTESDAGQYLCALQVHIHNNKNGNWKIIKNIRVSVHKDKGSEIAGNSADIEFLVRLCVTLPIILAVPIAVIVIYFWEKIRISPRSQTMELQTIQHRDESI